MTAEEKLAIVSRISGVVELDEANCEIDLIVGAAIKNMDYEHS